MHVRSVDGEERVTPLELFFDLVLVFAITQVTGFLAAKETGEGLLRGALLLAARVSQPLEDVIGSGALLGPV